jgi:2'-hydroxyisoflavone reductase
MRDRGTAGGRHVAPGDGLDTFQLVDVRDVAYWIVRCSEDYLPDAFNLTSQPMTWRNYLETSRNAISGATEWVWVDEAFLRTEGISQFFDMPAWNPRSERSGFTHISAGKAKSAGWSERALSVTALDAWRSYQQRLREPLANPIQQDGARWGISNAREQAILQDWDQWKR